MIFILLLAVTENFLRDVRTRIFQSRDKVALTKKFTFVCASSANRFANR